MDNNDMRYGYQPTVFQPAAGNGGQPPRKSSGRGRLVAGGVAAAVLVGGAAFGAVTMLGNSSPAAASSGPTGQAAVLSDALTGATTTAGSTTAGSTTAGSTANTTASTATQMKHRRDALARLRRLGGIDGQFTFETKSGVKTLAFERGTIQSVSGNDVVVKAKDGTTWNWTLVSDSVVREDGSKASNSALSAGELVFVGGPVVSGSHDARLIVVRDDAKSSGTGATPSGSTSAMVS